MGISVNKAFSLHIPFGFLTLDCRMLNIFDGSFMSTRKYLLPEHPINRLDGLR